MTASDIIILGGGIAGVSLAATIAGRASVTLIEVEDQLGRHSTGRSAAMFFESYGNAPVRALTRASRSFLIDPPAGFCETPLMQPRAALHVAPVARVAELDALRAMPNGGALERLTAEDARAIVPILSPAWLGGGVLDPSGFDIDVAALFQGYIRLARKHDVKIVTGARETGIVRAENEWKVATRAGCYSAPILVNAAGAWADEVAALAGVSPLGLRPLRRTGMTLSAPDGMDIRAWPLVIDEREGFYFKPDAGQLLLSPANEDPEVPVDVAPDDLDIALAIDRFERATTMSVRRVNHRWAGLRTFAPDRSPVVGFDSRLAGFFWLAGQGGYGIQTAPAIASLAAAMLLNAPLPSGLENRRLLSEIGPSRFSANSR